jgi:CRP-like cAMP-binding protein
VVRVSADVHQSDVYDHSCSDNDLNKLRAVRGLLSSGVSRLDSATIRAAARIKEFKRGEIFFCEGDSLEHVFLLESGLAKVTQSGVSGSEVILWLGAPGDVLGGIRLVSGGKVRATAQALRDCSALDWPAPAFGLLLMKRFPALHANLVAIVAERLLELQDRFRDLATDRVDRRVARQLVRLEKQFGRTMNGTVVLGLSRENVAQMTGTTLFTVSRLLSDWEGRGIVASRRESITICNPGVLRVMAGVAPGCA